MITSPKQYDPDSREAKVERAIERLKITQNAYAASVCQLVIDGLGNHSDVKKWARLSIAGGNGLLTLLKKRIERG